MIKNLKNGRTSKETVLCYGVEEKMTKKGDSYVELLVCDKMSSIKVIVWNTNKSHCDQYINQVIEITITPELYNGALSYKGDFISLKEDAKITDYIQTAPYNTETMYNMLYKIILSFGNEKLKKLVLCVLEENKEKLLFYPGAEHIHHNCHGGLLYHTYRMTWMALQLSKGYKSVNKDILIAGTILHDIGKTIELDSNFMGIADYSTDGKLLGHTYLGMKIIEQTAQKLNTPDEITRQLLHIIASHHGSLEWGALVKPQTLEACIVHYLDMIDSQAYQYEKIAETLEEGDFSSKIYGLGTAIYKPVKDGAENV